MTSLTISLPAASSGFLFKQDCLISLLECWAADFNFANYSRAAIDYYSVSPYL